MTVIVPTDQPTVQAAVTAAGAGGTVIINSNATFSETVTVTQSLTIHGGVGFTPTIRGTSACGVATSCTLFFEPNSESAQMLAVSDVRLLPKSGALASGPEVVRMLNQGAGDATMILSHCTIENPEGFGYLAVDIRRASCSSGLNHVAVQNGSINIAGANEAFTGEGGFQMAEGGSLAVSNIDLTLSGISAEGFDIAGTPACGGIIFGLSDSNISVTSPATSFSADLASLFLDVTATIERTSFQAISTGEGSTSGITVGGGTGQTYSASITLDANRFVGSGPSIGDAVQAAPFSNGSVVVKATNNVVQDMLSGFRLGQDVGNPAGDVTATLANNTVDGTLSDAISLNAASGSTVTVTAENNLLTDSGGWGVSFSSEPGGSPTISEDFNGFFNNATGNVQAPLVGGLHDVVGDPLYDDRDSGQLRLRAGSPMIDAGDNSFPSTATDVDGFMRIQNGTVDIGAFEGGVVIITAPPTDTASATPSPTDTPTRTPTSTGSATNTPPPLATSTPTQTATPTHTVLATPNATETSSRTPTPSNTAALPPSATSTPTVTPTATHTPTATSLSTFTMSPTLMATALTSQTPTLTPRPCVGDCSGSGVVSISNLILGVNIALGNLPVTACPAFESAEDQVDIAQLIKGVNNALNGCPIG